MHRFCVSMEHRLVLNKRIEIKLSADYMRGILHQQLKYKKYREVKTKKGTSVFYLFFQKEEDTYAALRAAKSIEGISLARYYPKHHDECETLFRPFPPQSIIDQCRFAFGKFLDKFANLDLFKTFVRRLSEQIMGQNIKLEERLDRIQKLNEWWTINRKFRVKNNFSIQKLLDMFFG